MSSPGLDRPLTKPAHFERAIGARIKVKTFEKRDNRRVYTGTLNWSTNAFENDEDSLRIDDPNVALSYTAEFDRAFLAATPL